MNCVKVLLSADMEGTTGAVDWNDMFQGKPEYGRFRRLLTGDVNFAIEGALEGGADEVVVTEAHAGMKNILLEELHPDASMISGNMGKTWLMMEGIDESFDAVFLVAYHAMEGTPAAIMSHTEDPHLITAVWLGDVKVGEVGLSSLAAGHFDVPVVLVTGDDKVAAEARALLGNIESAVVKYGISRYAARCFTPKRTSEMIMSAAERAVKRAGAMKPFKPEFPMEIRVELKTALQASQVSKARGIRLVDPTTVASTCVDVLEANQLLSEVEHRASDPAA
jgi:D-amino peptidase